nr:uncharacterized mitochondrial protein AtMg00810-like [Tanacetum cinerariifolium]
LKNQLEESLKEKDDLKLKLGKFETSYKNLTNLVNSQISLKDKTGLGYNSQLNEKDFNNKSDVFESAYDSSVNESEEDNNQTNDRYKAGEGYHAVPHPYTGNFMPPRPDLSFAGLDASVLKSAISKTITSVHETETSASKTSKESIENPKSVRPNAPIIEDWESGSDDDYGIRPLIEQNKPSHVKINFVKSDENARKSLIEQRTYKQAENLEKSQNSKSDKRNWNGMMTQRLVITKSGKVPVNTAKQSSPRAAASTSTARYINTTATRPTMNGAKPSSNVFHKSHSPVRRTFNQRTTPKNSDLKETINTAKVNDVTTAGTKALVSAVQGNEEMLLSPQHAGFGDQYKMLLIISPKTMDHTCLKDLTMLIFKADSKIDDGFVAFEGSPKGGKMSGKCKIRTGKLDFKDVYFVKKLMFNLFSISQMCDKNNSILFTEIECLVLSPDFKLLDENQVLLKVSRENNMYSFDLKNVAHSEGLTCLFAKATIDESNLWHRRLGHIDFKTMNKLVKGNLVRGLPSKIFENDHTCVTCQKGKQHKASCKTRLVSSISQPLQIIEIVTKPHNKTPYELLIGRSPNLDFMRPFGCPVTILNTLDHLGKFVGKADEGFLVGYSINSKAFRVFNSRTRKVEENMHIRFLENKSNVAGRGIEINVNAGQVEQEKASDHEYILLPFMPSHSPLSSSIQSSDDKDANEALGKRDEGVSKGSGIDNQERFDSSTQDVNTADMPSLEETDIFDNVYDDRELGAEADSNKLELSTVVYVDDIIFESTKKSLCDEFEPMMHKRFQMSSIRDLTFFLGLQVKQKDDGIFTSQDRYVADILKKFDFTTVKTASTPIEPNKALIKDTEAEDVDVHLYRSMIRSLMYLTSSTSDIMFAVYACARDSSFDLEAFSDSDYVGASLDKKSTTRGCQYFGKRLISWQCKKQTIVANSTTKAEYVATASCYGQPPLSSPSRILTRQETKVPQPSSPTHTHVADEAASTDTSCQREHQLDQEVYMVVELGVVMVLAFDAIGYSFCPSLEMEIQKTVMAQTGTPKPILLL